MIDYETGMCVDVYMGI